MTSKHLSLFRALSVASSGWPDDPLLAAQLQAEFNGDGFSFEVSFKSHLHALLQRSIRWQVSGSKWQKESALGLNFYRSQSHIHAPLKLSTCWHFENHQIKTSKEHQTFNISVMLQKGTSSHLIGTPCFVWRTQESLMPIIGSCKHCETPIANDLISQTFIWGPSFFGAPPIMSQWVHSPSYPPAVAPEKNIATAQRTQCIDSKESSLLTFYFSLGVDIMEWAHGIINASFTQVREV